MPFHITLIVILIRIDYRLYTIVVLNLAQPFPRHAAYFCMMSLHSLFTDFEIEYRRHVSDFQRSVVDKISHLAVDIRLNAQKMICTTYYPMALGLAEVPLEIRILQSGAFRRFDHGEENRLKIFIFPAAGIHTA